MPIYGPQPEDIYKEWTYQHIGHADSAHAVHFAEIDPNANHPLALQLREEHPSHTPRYINITDLTDAIRAEFVIEYWGGHIGTSFFGFRVNGSSWLPIPRPLNTPTDPERFHHTVLGSLTTPIPLNLLQLGTNCFQFGAGPQIDYGFDCGFFWIYSFTVRVYYSQEKPHPKGRIKSPIHGQCIGDFPVIETEIDTLPIAQVDFLAHYKDFNFEGDGQTQQWHVQRYYGTMRRHIGHRVLEPFSKTWDTTWVPDQEEAIQIMAQITAPDGVKYMTPSIKGLSLERDTRRVIMYEAKGVPENFSVRIGERKTCDFFLQDDMTRIKSARLVLSTWSGAHAEEIGLNDVKLVDKIGKVHDYSFDFIEIPLEILKKGKNTFYIFSTTDEHAAEINWPGPTLLVTYDK